ncbi:MAG: mechanosensitive ion channel family protein [Actinomycetota bacterium]
MDIHPSLPSLLATEELVVVENTIDRWDYLTALIIFVVALVLGQVVRAAAGRLIKGRPGTRGTRGNNFLGELIGRLGNYLIVTFGVIYALETIGVAIGPILGALGIAGIAMAFAFQDILENFVAGIILQIQGPFQRGDEIVTADLEGTVLAIDTRTITMVTPDGETVRVPSAEVLKNPIINHTQFGRRRTTLMVGVDYASDLDHVTDVANRVLDDLEEALPEPAPKVMVGEFGPSSIDLVIQYWHKPSIDDEWGAKDLVARALVKAFRQADINIPFPQRVVHVMPADLSRPEPQTNADH